MFSYMLRTRRTFGYAADAKDFRRADAQQILASAAPRDCVLAVQALGEFFRVATNKKKMPGADAERLVSHWLSLWPNPLSYGEPEIRVAMHAAAAGRFQFWDAMLLATAGAAGCTALISEDMGHGAQLAGVTVVRAFQGDAVSPEAAALLA